MRMENHLRSCQLLAKHHVKKMLLAFASLMRHIREIDSHHGTVVMMQVENEVGILDFTGKTPGNARRDFSEAADNVI